MNIKNYLKRSHLLLAIHDKMQFWKYKRLYKKDPKLASDYNFFKNYGRHINWDNPSHFEEKNFWLLHNSDISLWIQCADKFRVREYVKKKGLESILNDLYGEWEDARDIDFNGLPEKYVLKTNNGCNTIIIVKDKNKLKKEEVVGKMNKWLKYPYGIIAGQKHYLGAKPCIVAEKFLEDKKHGELIDYKFYCFHGKVHCVMVCSGRNVENHIFYADILDTQWKNLKVTFFPAPNDIEKPESYDEMIKISEILSEGIPYVRVDLYEVDGKPIFGEMTFTPDTSFITEEYNQYMGSLIHLNK